MHRPALLRLTFLVAPTVLAACDPINPCPSGDQRYDPGPPRQCIFPDGGSFLLDDAGAESDAGTTDGGVDAAPCPTPTTLYPDRDADGYGDASEPTATCGPTAGYVTNGLDCDDTCGECAPGNTETCNGLDDDCSGVADDADAVASCMRGPGATGVECVGGVCATTGCDVGLEDCNGVAADGCEVTLGTLDDCSACGDVCAWECGATGCNDPTSISAGGDLTCATLRSREVVCWGSGPIGSAAPTPSAEPRYVISAPPGTARLSAISQVTVGNGHACASGRPDLVACWGAGGRIGQSTPSVYPVTVMGAYAASFSAGAQHTCASYLGVIRCWGSNGRGQLGDGTISSAVAPVRISGLIGYAVAAGDAHTCAASTDAVYCWGANDSGQLGDGTRTERRMPTLVSGQTGVVSIAAGAAHTCAATEIGDVYCWGENADGAIGDGTDIDRLSPVRLPALTASRVFAAGRRTCAIDDTGASWCWGDNTWGVLGDDSATRQRDPVRTVLGEVRGLALGEAHSCALDLEDRVLCWGNNAVGQLGRGTMSAPSYTPVFVVAPSE